MVSESVSLSHFSILSMKFSISKLSPWIKIETLKKKSFATIGHSGLVYSVKLVKSGQMNIIHIRSPG